MTASTVRIEYVVDFPDTDPREIPCRDMDLDCLPDSDGRVPFGAYDRCQCYAPARGRCPFLPLELD